MARGIIDIRFNIPLFFIVIIKLGQACILLSTLEEDPDAAIEAFDKGTKLLQETLKRHPEKEKLAKQVQALCSL